MAVVRTSARSLSGADGVSFILRDGVHCYYADEDAISPLWRGSRFPLEQCVSGMAMLGREPIVIPDIYADPRVPIEAYRPTFVKGMYMVPIGHEESVAAIGAYWARTHAATDDQQQVLKTLANAASLAFRNIDAERALQDSNRRKDEFLATLAHELRNPLAPIRNAVQLLKLSPTSDPQLHKACGIIERQVHQMVRLIDDLMEVSRFTLGKISLQRERHDLRDILSGAVESVERRIKAAEHSLQVQLPQAAVNVYGDATRLSQVFQNLLDNACKYTPRGGSITVSVGQVGSEATVLVRDNGVGVPAELRSRVFEMFTRAHPTDKIKATGLGIGLALAKRITELHGGRIGLHSDGHGKGASFSVHLPVSDAAAASETEKVPGRAAAPQAERRVLVVDDNRDAAESLAMLLRQSGSTVDVAFDGLSALESFQRSGPEVVFLDIGMPDMDGYQVARRIRASARGDAVVLVALTGWAQDEDRRKAALAGFDAHMVKPVDPREVSAFLAAQPTSLARLREA